jgi:hypothetical protein
LTHTGQTRCFTFASEHSVKRWILACFATLGLLVLVASPAAAVPGGNAENAKDCQNGGYVHYNDAQGNPFKSVGECVSSLAQGVPTISVVRNGTADIYGQQGTNILYCAYLVTYFNFDESNPPSLPSTTTGCSSR